MLRLRPPPAIISVPRGQQGKGRWMSFNLSQQCRRSGRRRMLSRDKPDELSIILLTRTIITLDLIHPSRDVEDIFLDIITCHKSLWRPCRRSRSTLAVSDATLPSYKVIACQDLNAQYDKTIEINRIPLARDRP